MSTLPLAGTSTLLTGGGSGIGLGCARALVRDGGSVTLMGRTEARLVAAADDLRSAAPSNDATVTIAVGDASSEDDVVAAVAVARQATGGLDGCVASAGTGGLGPVIALPLDEWNRVIVTNLTGTFLTMKHACAAMAASGGGSFVAISSIAAPLTHPYMSPYCVSKAGIETLVRNAADE